ncbi:hypothetical protein B9T38_12115 [Acinetobacter sp. ANC 4218]|jgi:hypothetical protein|uniref:GIY-YIG nuclease family protein n=1 Tax=Acinetobacter sp. ANC 4218 TaxID=1977880 RepID=UPI000A32BFD4|nr:GIY-YIG nuclease family protein [Acinetobacter sp. ANC 4218]OTG70599.1 hypothetical protein B9T38_12115 [Acinetobacter sp. ANC 4218]
MSQQPDQYVYILYNKYCPFVYKIGKTTRTPKHRARELSRETGTPGEWEVGHQWIVDDCDAMEILIHNHFKQFRISPRNEHFEFKGQSIEHVAEKISLFLNMGGESPKRAAEIAEKQRQLEYERAERARIEKQQREAREFECKRLIKEIKQQVSIQIKKETPLFASQIERQRIQDKYFKYQNLPFNLDQLRQLKNELIILQTTKANPLVGNEPNQSDPLSNFIWLFVGVITIAVIAFLIIDPSNPAKTSSPVEYPSTQISVNDQPIQNQPQEEQEENSDVILSSIPNAPQNYENIEQNVPQTYQYQEPIETPIKPTKTYQFNQPVEKQVSLEEAKQAHYSTILAKHPDAMEVIERPSFNSWLSKQPDYIKESYEYTLDKGTASQVIEMLDHYKKDTGY